MKRYALVAAPQSYIEPYLPSNYKVIGNVPVEGKALGHTVIAGEDKAGWTLDDYVIPRLESGLYFATEIDLSHPVMKQIPENAR